LPFGTEPVQADACAVGIDEVFDIELILRPEGKQLEQNQALNRGDPHRLIEPAFVCGVVQYVCVCRDDGLEQVDSDSMKGQHCHMMLRPCTHRGSHLELEAAPFQVLQQCGQDELWNGQQKIHVLRETRL
jgi:hypothetical protein